MKSKNFCWHLFALVFVTTLVVGAASVSSALPFNDDMVLTPLKRSGSMSRGKVPGTVAIGELSPYSVEKEEDTQNWKNPRGALPVSVKNGARLFRVNCAVCHGYFTDQGREMSPVSSKLLIPGPDLGDAIYTDRTDGFFYGTIHFGGAAVMPPVGWKLSPDETWDIVSYLRSVQQSR